MKEKFDEFLKIAKELNGIGITPLLMGSLGLEQVTGTTGKHEILISMFQEILGDGTHLMRYEFMILKRLKRL